MPISRIDEVLIELDRIIVEATERNSPEAYFAYVYRYTTAAIKRAVETGRFEDGERMERFDVAFARLYLDAHSAYRRREPCSACWDLSFRASGQGGVTVLQHISLGMNAHINLDLGVAAGRIMWGEDLRNIQTDFDTVNEVLAEIIDGLQEKVARVSPLLGLVDRLAKGRDEVLLDRGMQIGRTQAWAVAERIWEAGPEGEGEVLARVDRNVTKVGESILRPRSRLLRWAIRAAARLEPSSVGVAVAELREA